MIRQPDILCISSIDWDFIWQGHQEIMSTLAAQGHRVLFLENTGVRAPQVRDLPRVRQRIRNWWRGTKGFREERPNLFVYSPLVLPLAVFAAGPLGQPLAAAAIAAALDARDRLLSADRLDVSADAARARPDPRSRSRSSRSTTASTISPRARWARGGLSRARAAVPRGRSGVRHVREAAPAGRDAQRSRASVSVRRKLRARSTGFAKTRRHRPPTSRSSAGLWSATSAACISGWTRS